jgi:hypothetical protein
MRTLLWNDSDRETRYAALMSALAAGGTVYVMTARGAIKVTPKVAAKWNATGRPIFKLAKGSLYIGAGRRYDCIDYNHIQIGT